MEFYPLYSGSTGNASLAVHNKTKLLIDAGVTGKAALYALSCCGVEPCSISGILISHSHSDHVKGAGILSRKLDLPIYANEATWEELDGKLGRIDEKNRRVFETDMDFSIGDMRILPFSIPHDTADPVGFSIECDGKKLTIATDIGHVTEKVTTALRGSDLVLIEANHDEELLRRNENYSAELKRRILGRNGHLSTAACGGLLADLYKTGVKRAVLGHLSRENNTEQLAYKTVSHTLASAGIGADYMLKVAHYDRVCGKFEV